MSKVNDPDDMIKTAGYPIVDTHFETSWFIMGARMLAMATVHKACKSVTRHFILCRLKLTTISIFMLAKMINLLQNFLP